MDAKSHLTEQLSEDSQSSHSYFDSSLPCLKRTHFSGWFLNLWKTSSKLNLGIRDKIENKQTILYSRS